MIPSNIRFWIDDSNFRTCWCSVVKRPSPAAAPKKSVLGRASLAVGKDGMPEDSRAQMERIETWRIKFLVGVFLIFFYLHPENWGRFPFWRSYFSKGLEPPTRFVWTHVFALFFSIPMAHHWQKCGNLWISVSSGRMEQTRKCWELLIITPYHAERPSIYHLTQSNCHAHHA